MLNPTIFPACSLSLYFIHTHHWLQNKEENFIYLGLSAILRQQNAVPDIQKKNNKNLLRGHKTLKGLPKLALQIQINSKLCNECRLFGFSVVRR